MLTVSSHYQVTLNKLQEQPLISLLIKTNPRIREPLLTMIKFLVIREVEIEIGNKTINHNVIHIALVQVQSIQ